ncbi:hypothetical protein J4Q44_G00078360 [Coregonus suidteri]|uniref:Biogenesis of lysosome-related organelles complex 1 subunit 1 n=1 Tax=Coregonus suidteri TaxID=861788 RepID=A0AAN8MB78_9TELE
MLSRLLKEHQSKQNERKELQEGRRREAITAATCLTEALVDHLNVGVAKAYVNQRKLDHEVKTLQVQAGQFSKQTGQWISMVEGFNQALKEIGDVENWARSIEMDMRTIATALDRDNLWRCYLRGSVDARLAVQRQSESREHQGEVCVGVTGCDSGFGNLLCKRLDRRGFRVIAGCLTEKGADDLKSATGPYMKTVLLDVTSTARLWGIVNNEGRSLPMGPSEWMRLEAYTSPGEDRQRGTFLPLIKQAHGRIINVASVLGRVAANGRGYLLSSLWSPSQTASDPAVDHECSL